MALIRIFTPYFPFPPYEGAFQVIYDQARGLVELGHEVELLVWKSSREDAEREILVAKGPEAFDRRIRMRFLDDEPRSESSRERVARILGSLATGRSSAEEFFYPEYLADAGLSAANESGAALNIFHYSFAYSWLRRLGGRPLDGRNVIVFHNLESDLYWGRGQAAFRSASPASLIHFVNWAMLASHQRKLAGWVDELWFISPADREDFAKSHPDARTRFVSPTFNPSVWSSRIPKRTGKLVLGLIGALDHLPNEESARWVIDRLAPVLSASSFRGEIWIVGKGAPAWLIKKASSYPFLRFLGFVPDLEDYWDSVSFSLAPHVTGSGVRIKLLESLASGVPVLTNSESARRIDPALRDHPHLFVEESPEKWAEVLLRTEPMAERERFREMSMPGELKAAQVYRFLEGQLASDGV